MAHDTELLMDCQVVFNRERSLFINTLVITQKITLAEFKSYTELGAGWLMPIILAIQEAEIRRIVV
jgi:hypothetical protein